MTRNEILEVAGKFYKPETITEREIAFARHMMKYEREACAKVCDEHAKVYASLDQTPATKSAWAACIDNRDAIQAREKHDLDN